MADNIANGNASAIETKAVFKQIYYDLKKELLQDPAFDFTDESREWIDKVWLHFFNSLLHFSFRIIYRIMLIRGARKSLYFRVQLMQQLLERAYKL